VGLNLTVLNAGHPLHHAGHGTNRSLLLSHTIFTQDLSILTDRLSKINESLARKVQARNEYDKTIQETEAAYMKVGNRTCTNRKEQSQINTIFGE